MYDKKSLFNFYLDLDDKEKATEKLERLCGKSEKGQFASLIRVLIKNFIDTPDEEITSSFKAEIIREYCNTQFRNKRSKM